MAKVNLRNVSKHFGSVEAVKSFDLEIEDKEFLVLSGPSGCGKSTTLRMVAGLEELTSGNIYIGDRLVNDMREPKITRERMSLPWVSVPNRNWRLGDSSE